MRKPRYVVKALPVTPKSRQIVHRVYDNEKASYPIFIHGRRLEQSYSTPEAAQAVADDLNRETL